MSPARHLGEEHGAGRLSADVSVLHVSSSRSWSHASGTLKSFPHEQRLSSALHGPDSPDLFAAQAQAHATRPEFMGRQQRFLLPHPLQGKAKTQLVLALCFTESDERYHYWRVFAPSANGVCIRFNRSGCLQPLASSEACR